MSVGHGGGVGELSLLFFFLAVNSSPLCGSSPMMSPFGSLCLEGLFSSVDGGCIVPRSVDSGSFVRGIQLPLAPNIVFSGHVSVVDGDGSGATRGGDVSVPSTPPPLKLLVLEQFP